MCQFVPSTSEREGSKGKNGEHEDVMLGKGCEEFPNSATIGQIQISFGKLCRVGSLRGDVWKTIVPWKTCHLVHSHSCYTEDKSSSMEC